MALLPLHNEQQWFVKLYREYSKIKQTRYSHLQNIITKYLLKHLLNYKVVMNIWYYFCDDCLAEKYVLDLINEYVIKYQRNLYNIIISYGCYSDDDRQFTKLTYCSPWIIDIQPSISSIQKSALRIAKILGDPRYTRCPGNCTGYPHIGYQEPICPTCPKTLQQNFKPCGPNCLDTASPHFKYTYFSIIKDDEKLFVQDEQSLYCPPHRMYGQYHNADGTPLLPLRSKRLKQLKDAFRLAFKNVCDYQE